MSTVIHRDKASFGVAIAYEAIQLTAQQNKHESTDPSTTYFGNLKKKLFI